VAEPKILFLGPHDSPLLPRLDGEVHRVDTPVTLDDIERIGPDVGISFGYRHIVPKPVIDALPGRLVNLHISVLPHNRGADPNPWSWIDGTPKGVTIHHIDEHLDTGDIIAQREVAFAGTETLAETYQALQDAIVDLFVETWPAIRAGTAPRHPQPPGGSYHRAADRDRFMHLLTDGWQTPVRVLRDTRL
jgi:methionyl-tRNA formyltransferase